VRAICSGFYGTEHEGVLYRLKYGHTQVDFNTYDPMEAHWKTHGAPDAYLEKRLNTGGRETLFDGITNPNVFTVSAYSTQVNPKKVVDEIAFCLSLQPYDGTIASRPMNTAFIAVRFNDEGLLLAGKLKEVLKEINVDAETGEEFVGDAIPPKIKRMIDEKHIFIAIIVPQEDKSWVLSECVYAESNGKTAIILDQHGTSFNPGILGKDKETIPFAAGHMMDEIHKVLHKIKKMRGET
ncbi:MAG: hypothetical protein AB7O26_08240, partial [Planctomycetaceae bacterium]